MQTEKIAAIGRRYLPALITLSAGLLLTATLFIVIRDHEEGRRQLEFDRRAALRIAALRHGLHHAVDALASANRLFEVVRPLSDLQFRQLAMPLLASHRQLRAIVYQRLVSAQERAAYEAERRRASPGFGITMLAAGRLVPAPARAQYRVIDYYVPTAGNAWWYGLDALALPAATATESCQSGSATVTVLSPALLEGRATAGFMLLMPVHVEAAPLTAAGASCPAVAGYTGVALASAGLIETMLGATGLPGTPDFHVQLTVGKRDEPGVLVDENGDGSRAGRLAALLAAPARGSEASFEVAGQQWHVAIEPGLAVPWSDSLGSLLMLAIGSAGSLLAAAYAGTITAGAAVRVKEARSRQLLRQAIDACFNSIVIIRATAPAYAIEYANPAFEKMTGYTAGEVSGRDSAMLWRGDQADGRARNIVDMVREQRDGIAVLRSLRKDGSTVWTECNIAPVKSRSGVVTHFVVVHSDVSEKRRYESELEYQATHDPLTGLVNRAVLSERLSQEIASAERHQRALWVILVDLDRFKFVNDRVGYPAGDRCLQQMAQRLAEVVRPEDIVARLRGDEFMLVMSERGDGRLHSAVLDRIKLAIARPVMVEGQEFLLSASLGVACFPQDSADPEVLIEYADLAMYRAKQSGRDNYQFYLPELNRQAQQRLHLESGLRNALGQDEFEVHYQPQLDLRSGAIVGVEAVLRWRHPELGLLASSHFLELAEDTGLIVPIGAWALQRACADLRTWQRNGWPALRLTVGLTLPQFNQPGLAEIVGALLDGSGLLATCLELQLTERTVTADMPRALALLGPLRARGIGIAIHNCGTSYTSLAQLNDLPVDALRIDQSFVGAISNQGSNAAIPNAIVSLAHSLGMRVSVDGVESEAQCEFLARNMCDEIQGPLFSMPLAAEAMGGLLAAGAALAPHLLRMHRRQHTLLLVDDEPNILAALKRQFRGTGLRLLTAPGGKEGLALLESETVDVIISDQRMPGMTGVEFLRAVKNSHPDTVRIVLSGFTELQSVTDAVNEGAIYKFLTKPWDDAQLRRHIEEAVRHKEMADENRRLDLEVRTANHGLAQVNRQLEEVARQQQEQLARTGISLEIVREALQHVPMPIVGLDDEQAVAFANLAAQQLFSRDGMQLGEPAARFMADVLDTLDRADGARSVQRHGATFQISARGMGDGTRSRGRLILFNPQYAPPASSTITMEST